MFHFDIDFKDKNGERHMLPIRIQVLLRDLHARAYPYREALGGIEYRDGKYPAGEHGGTWLPFDPEKDFWGGRDTYIWFRHRFTVPESLAGKTLLYTVEAGDSGYWQWANPQMCLYLNGRCMSGMDSNHREVEFTADAVAGEAYAVDISGYTDTVYYERPVRFRPYLTAVEPEILSLYYDLKVAYDAAHELDADDIARVDLIHYVNEAFNRLDMTAAGEDFLASVRETAAYLRKNAYTGSREGRYPVIAAVGSTHIDVAWLWRYEQTREKACRSFATALRLLEKNPEYIFMCSQPQLYAFVQEDEPALFAEIQKWVAAGRWEVEGAMWIEADTNLPSGESLVRQLLFGKRFFREAFGKDSEVMWLPDVFGYSAALPQILKKSGVHYFMTTKISWNEYNKLPYDTFYWRGIDGSSVLSHFIATKERVQEEKDWMTTYNGQLNPSSVSGAWQRYQQKDLNREILASFGHGDGGGGTSQEMLESGKRLAMGLPGMPDLQFSGVLEYYKRLERELEGQRRVPIWDGELYFEYHRGTYTSVAGIKRRNRKNEIRSHDAENLSVLSALLLGTMYPSQALAESWRLLLLNQFHDVIPGSSIAPVYEDAYAHHDRIEALTTAAAETAMDALCAEIDGTGLAVFNTLSFTRDAPVVFSCDAAGEVALRDGETLLPAVRQADGSRIFYAEGIPAKGWRCFEIVPADSVQNLDASPDCMENDEYLIEFDAAMHIRRFFCKRLRRELLPTDSVGARLLAFEDVPRCDDAWNIMAYYEEKSWVVDDVRSARITENNALRTVLRVERRFRSSQICAEYILWRDRPGLTLRFDIDWRETNLLLKLDFPADVNTTRASFDIQFGSIERQIHKNTLWDYARFEVCAHKWVDLSDNGFGLSLLNDCKYGYDVSRRHIRMSVLRCATYPDPMQDKCRHTFACMLLPHGGPVDLAEVNRAAYGFNYPLHVRSVHSGGKLPAQYALLDVDCENVLVETVKQAENGEGIVLRAFECANAACEATLTLGFAAKCAWETDLLEQTLAPLPVRDGKLRLRFEPFEIKTILIK